MPSFQTDSAWVARLPARNFFRRLCLVKTRTDNDDAAAMPGNEVDTWGLWPALMFDSCKELLEQVAAVGLENMNSVRSKLTVQYCQLARSAPTEHAVAYLLGKGGVEKSMVLLPKTKEGELHGGHIYEFSTYVDEMMQGKGHCATEEFQEAFELAMDRMQAATLGRRGKREKEATLTTVGSRRKTFAAVEYAESYVFPRKQSKGVAKKASALEEPEEDEPGEEEAHPEINSVQFTEQQESSSPEKPLSQYSDEDRMQGARGVQRHGKGKTPYVNWKVYEGVQRKFTYANGTFSANGNVYEGDWDYDMMHGKGRCTFANGNVCEGEWVDGKNQGQCKFTFADGSLYEGGWKRGSRNGEGKMKWADETVYEGGWVDGNRQGTGTHTSTNGDAFTGEWESDKKHGVGILKEASGSEYTGEWKDGEKHGAGTLKEANGTEYKQEYSNGELLASKRIANTADDVPPSQRPRTGEARGMVLLNDNELGCWNCGEDYIFDMNATEDDERNLLPVITTSCDHTCCHGCILKWQVARAEMNDRPVAKRVPCMLCKKKSAICPSEPKYNRMLIDLLGRCSR